jgi:plastocyanin
MRALFLMPLALAAPGASPAQPAHPRTVEVRLSSFDFTPSTINLRPGEPVLLRLVNSGSGGHNFAAPQFFAAASNVSGPIRNGRVEVGGHRAVDIRVTPARGSYRLRCTHMLHSTLGMNGRIVVQ